MNIPEPVRRLEEDLHAIFGPRLSSLSIYLSAEARSAKADGRDHGDHRHAPTHTLAVVDGLSGDDLRACAARVEAWHDAGLATPLLSGAKVDVAARHIERMLGLTSGILAEIVALAGVREISSAEADRLFAPYLDAIERLVKHIDGWNA